MQDRKQFDRINLLNYMANDIVAFAAQKYGEEFFEFIDMKCGAVPEGEYEKIIDPAAPQVFLELYTNIVINRFSLACAKVLELGEGYDKVLSDYLFNSGANLGLPKPASIKDAFDLIQLSVLDGMYSKQKIEFVMQDDSRLEWKKNCGKDFTYWNLMRHFVLGLIAGSGIDFSVDENLNFCLHA